MIYKFVTREGILLEKVDDVSNFKITPVNENYYKVEWSQFIHSTETTEEVIRNDVLAIVVITEMSTVSII